MRKKGRGERCTYCVRVLEGPHSRSRVAASRDHVVPAAHGGISTVWCCRQCNQLKGDMTPAEWSAFMIDFPRWWGNPDFSHYGVTQKIGALPFARRIMAQWRSQYARKNPSPEGGLFKPV